MEDPRGSDGNIKPGVKNMKVISLLTDYHRQEEASQLLAIISFIQEKRKKKSFWSKKEEVLKSIRKGFIPLRSFSFDNFSLILDDLCSFEPIFRLEDVSSWENAILTLEGFDYKSFISKASSLASFRPLTRNIKLSGVLPSNLFHLLNYVREMNLEPPRIEAKCDPASSPELKDLMSRDEIDSFERAALKFRELASKVRLMGERLAKELDSWIDRYPSDSSLNKEYRREKERVVSAYNSLSSRLEEAARQYEMLVSTLTSAPRIKKTLMPVYLVETKGKAERRFIIANLKFKRPGLGHRIKSFFGAFDSLFEETDSNRKISSILRTDRISWSPNLLSEEIKEPIYGELARLEEEGYIDEKYSRSIADLLSKSLL